ncbi:hypothetical protein SGPA1_21805 [Streptomyces misionensis JCM 4497]
MRPRDRHGVMRNIVTSKPYGQIRPGVGRLARSLCGRRAGARRFPFRECGSPLDRASAPQARARNAVGVCAVRWRKNRAKAVARCGAGGQAHSLGHGSGRSPGRAGRRGHAPAGRGQRGRLRRRARRYRGRGRADRDERPVRAGERGDRAGGPHQRRRDRARGTDGRIPRLLLPAQQAAAPLPRGGHDLPRPGGAARVRRRCPAGGEPHHLGHDDRRRGHRSAALGRAARRSGLVPVRGRDLLDGGVHRPREAGGFAHHAGPARARGGRSALRLARRLAGAQGDPGRRRHRRHRHRPGRLGDGDALPSRHRVHVPRGAGHPDGALPHRRADPRRSRGEVRDQLSAAGGVHRNRACHHRVVRHLLPAETAAQRDRRLGGVRLPLTPGPFGNQRTGESSSLARMVH